MEKKAGGGALLLFAPLPLPTLLAAAYLKKAFSASAPARILFFLDQVRLLLKQCSGSYSFTSSHAANHFGMATFVSITLYPTFKRWIYFAYLWAFFISYAQIYVGVHYPLDVLGGAIVGVLAGLLTASVFNKQVGSFNLAL